MNDSHPPGPPDHVAERLEALGRLAPGIAHELSTPAQYLGDNAHFLRGAWQDLGPLFDVVARIRDRAAADPVPAEDLAALVAAAETADLEYLRVEIPELVEQSIVGVQRIAALVGAIKTFARHDQQGRAAFDVTQLLDVVLAVARNELKYLAETTTDFAADPLMVTGNDGDVSLAVLHLLLAAARAVADARDDSRGQRGLITVATRPVVDGVEIRISARGPRADLPASSRSARPSPSPDGSGLSIARDVIVGGHGGTLRVGNGTEDGTTWIVTLPLSAAA